MKVRHSLLVIAAALCGAAPLVLAANGSARDPRSGTWAHEESSLKPDPRVTWGRLDNGFRYALLPHDGVPGSVALRLVVLSGSLDETDDERGIAHFTEHMAFHGTRNFPYEEMVGFFQRLGMEYGSDVNAFTSFDNTTYALDFREGKPELLNEGMRLFRDFADGILFKPAHIRQECSVILSELRGRDGLQARASMAAYGTLFRGLRFPERYPGGTEEEVRSHTREKFLRFYQRSYRPDLMILVAVGDFDPAAMKGWVAERFGDIPKSTAPLPSRDVGRLDTAKALRAGVFKVTGVGGAAAKAASVQLPPSHPDTQADRVLDDQRTFVSELLAKRIEASSFGMAGGSAHYESMLGYPSAFASASVSSEEWSQGVTGLDEVIRGTWQQGFEEREIEPLRDGQVKMLTFLAEQTASLDPATLAGMLAESITEHRVYTGLDADLATHREWLKTFNARQATEVFRGMWDLERMGFQIDGNVDIPKGESEVVKALKQARRSPPRNVRPETRREIEITLRRWGTPGAVILRKDVPELGLQELRFANNVRLNFVHSRQNPGLVSVVVRVGNGLLDMPGDQPALKEFGLDTLLASGTAHFTVEQLGRTVEDHLLGFSVDADDYDAFSFRGVSETDKVDVFFEIVAEFLSRPLFENAAHREAKLMAAMSRLAGSIGMQEGNRLLYNRLFAGDPRFTWASVNNYIGLSLVDVRNWLQGPLTRGYVEVTVIGDLSEDEAVRAVARTLGALPVRDAGKRIADTVKPPKVTAQAGYERIEFVGEKHLGLVIGTWPIESTVTIEDRSALHVLTKILEQRILKEIREDLGMAYSPSASYEPFSGFPQFGWIQAMIDCSPDEAPNIAPIVERIAAEMARDGVTEGEVIGARGILASQIRHVMHDNGSLLELVQRVQERPESLEEALALKSGVVDKTTLEQVNAWAARILPASNSYTAAIVPKPFVGIFQADQPQATGTGTTKPRR